MTSAPPTPRTNPPGPGLVAPMGHPEKMRIRAAAFRVTRLYPGPVGELLRRELLTWEEFGYRLGGERLIMRLVDHALSAPLTDGEALRRRVAEEVRASASEVHR